jgi:hypothetical protein
MHSIGKHIFWILNMGFSFVADMITSLTMLWLFLTLQVHVRL